MNNVNNNVESKAIKFFDEKGFYIVLILCVLAVGIAAYVFLFAGNTAEEEIDLDSFVTQDQSVIPSSSYYQETYSGDEDITTMDVPDPVTDVNEPESVAVSSESVTTVKKTEEKPNTETTPKEKKPADED